jgi:hypothetical protein
MSRATEIVAWTVGTAGLLGTALALALLLG